ncbi:MAG: hypothetical protein K6E35_07420 [Bacteroidales bacterium]|nr:hypothetical protein [Bacteroidales bacterium]
MSKSFHKNFVKNFLLLPFRLFSSAVGYGLAVLSGGSRDKVIQYSYSSLYEDAVKTLKEEEEKKEEELKRKEGLSEDPDRMSREKEIQALDERIAALRSEAEMLNDSIFTGCNKVGELYELKGVKLPDGSLYIAAPTERRGIISERLARLDPKVVVVSSDELAKIVAKSDSAGGLGEGVDKKDALLGPDGVKYVSVSPGEVSRMQKRSIDGVKVISEKKFAALSTKAGYTPVSLDPLMVKRTEKTEFSYLFDAVRQEVQTIESFYGVSESGKDFARSLASVCQLNASLVENARKEGVDGLREDDQLMFRKGLFLNCDEKNVRLMVSNPDTGKAMELCSVSFHPESGEGKEFKITLGVLKDVLENRDGKYSDAFVQDVKDGLHFDGKTDTVSSLVDRYMEMRGPELCEVWSDVVRHPNNISVLSAQNTMEGFLSEVRRSKIDESQERKEKLTVKVEKTVNETVKVTPKLLT